MLGIQSFYPGNRITTPASVFQRNPTYSGPMYYGKYRGIVKDNNDPEKQGRVILQVPFVTGDALTDWALPNFPIASNKYGFYAVPQIDDCVWVEYEQGIPDYPIYGGSWYASNSLPDEITDNDVVALTTLKSMGVVLDNNGGILTVKNDSLKIELNVKTGAVNIVCSSVSLAGGGNGVARVGDSVSVTVNGTPYTGTITSGSSTVTSS